MKKQTIHNLFDVVRDFTLAGGGDGDGSIVSSDYRILADLFEEYERNSPWFTQKVETEFNVIFYNNQESIYFSGSLVGLPPCPEITVNIPGVRPIED